MRRYECLLADPQCRNAAHALTAQTKIPERTLKRRLAEARKARAVSSSLNDEELLNFALRLTAGHSISD